MLAQQTGLSQSTVVRLGQVKMEARTAVGIVATIPPGTR